MKGSPMVAVLLAACATGGGGSPCGNSEPVEVMVDSDHFADVVIRDADGVRLGMAYGHRLSRFHFCAQAGMAPRFMLDPVGGGMGYILSGDMAAVPGSTVLMKLGNELRISFAAVLPPEHP